MAEERARMKAIDEIARGIPEDVLMKALPYIVWNEFLHIIPETVWNPVHHEFVREDTVLETMPQGSSFLTTW